MHAIVSFRVFAPLVTVALLVALVGGAVATRSPQADASSGGPLVVAGIQSPSPLSDTRPPRSPRPGQVVASTPAQTGPSQRPARSTRPLNSANAATSAGVVASDAALAASNAAVVASNEAAASAGVVASDAAASTSAGIVASDSALASVQAASSASAGVVASDAAVASASAAVVASDIAVASASAAALPLGLSITFDTPADGSVELRLTGSGLKPLSVVEFVVDPIGQPPSYQGPIPVYGDGIVDRSFIFGCGTTEDVTFSGTLDDGTPVSITEDIPC